MRRSLLIVMVLSLVIASCGGVKKRSKKGAAQAPVVPQAVIKEPAKEVVVPVVKQEPVKEVEEKIVPIDNKPVDPSRYFVIIGSFRNQDNARRHQVDIAVDGFRESALMRNEAGLYRVSVLATDDVSAARTEVLRIRSRFPKYNDVWLLISKK